MYDSHWQAFSVIIISFFRGRWHADVPIRNYLLTETCLWTSKHGDDDNNGEDVDDDYDGLVSLQLLVVADVSCGINV